MLGMQNTEPDQVRRVLELADRLFDAPPDVVEAALAAEAPQTAGEVRAMLAIDSEGEELESFEVTDALMHTLEPEPPAPFAPEGFLIHEVVGRGAMGEVFRATQLVPRREVALKRVDGDGLREAQALADASHPAIPTVFVVGDTPGGAFVAMELVEGVPLDDWARAASRDQRLEALEQLCRAVHAIHAAGVLHRDLKPANVLMGPSGVRLVDFGLAVDVGVTDGALAGTLRYLADEVLTGEPASVRSDVFSLTALALEVLTGEPAMPEGRSPSRQRSARERWTPPFPAGPLGAVLGRGLAPVAERYASAEALADALARIRNAPVQRRRRRALLMGLGAALALASAAAWPTLESTLRERRASDQLDRALVGPTEGLPARLTGLLELEQLSGTHAQARARLERAKAWRALGDTERELEDLALLFGAGPLREEAAPRLAGILVDQGRWTALDVVWPAVPDPVLREELARTAGLGLRDAERPGLDGLERDLLHGRQTAWRARDLWSVDGGYIGFLPGEGLRFARGLDEVPPATWHPSWGRRRPLLLDAGNHTVVVDRGHGELTLVEPEGTTWRETGTVPIDGKLWTAVSVDPDGDGQPTRYLGTAAHPRSLWRVDPTGVPVPADDGIERTDADVEQLLAADLDGDGRDEIIVHLGPWNAHDVRVYAVESDGTLILRARERLGGFGDIAVLDLPDGPPRLVVVKHDAYPNSILFGDEAPFGRPQGVYVFRYTGDALVLEHERAIHDLRPTWRSSLVGDLDGDGLDELITDSFAGMLVLAFAPDGSPRSERRIGRAHALAVADTDGDPADELLVTLDDAPDVWVLGEGETPVPPLPAETRATDALEIVGLYGPAARHRHTLADLAESPGDSAHHLAEAARLHALEGAFDAALEALGDARSLADSPELQARETELLHHLGRSAPDEMAPHGETLDFTASQLPDLVWRRPTALHHVNGEGLEIVASSGDGVLARLPLQRRGDVLGVEVDLDVLASEAGAKLSVALRDASGADLGVFLSTWGGANRLDRKLSCLAGPAERDLATPAGIPQPRLQPAHVDARAVLHHQEVVCDLRFDDEWFFVRRPTSLRPDDDLVLEISVRGGNPAAQVRALLRSVVLTGVERAGPVEPRGREVVEGRLTDGLLASDDPVERIEILGRLARLEEARSLFGSLNATDERLLPAVRRQPELWLDLLRTSPERRAQIVARGWIVAYASGGGFADRSLERTWVDGIPISTASVVELLLRHGERLLERGAHERARRVFERLEPVTTGVDRGRALLGLASAEVLGGRLNAAIDACERARLATAGTFLYDDRVGASDTLRDVCER